MAHPIQVSQYFNPKTQPVTGTAPAHVDTTSQSLSRKMWKGVSWAGGMAKDGALWTTKKLTLPLSIPAGHVAESGGEGFAKGFAKGAKEEFLNPEFIQQGKEILQNALLAESSEKTRELSILLKKAVQRPDKLTAKDIQRISDLYQTLPIKDFETLGLTESGMQVLNEMGELVLDFKSQLLPEVDLSQDIFDEENSLPIGEDPTFIHEACKEEGNKKLFRASAAIFAKIVQLQQGCLRNAADYLTDALLEPDKGLLDQLIDAATDKEKGLIKKFAVSLQMELARNDEEAILPTFAKNLGERLEYLEKRLTTPLHADLATLRKCMAECEMLLKKNPSFSDDIEGRLGIAYAKVRHINNNQSIVCPNALDPKEEKLLATLETFLQQSLENNALTLENVHDANTFIDDLCQKQMGSVTHLGESFNKEFVGPALDQLKDLGQELADQMTKPLHPDLTALKKLVKLGKQAIDAPKQNQKEIQKRVGQSLALVNKIIQNKDTIFSKRPLTKPEENNLAKLQRTLQRSLNENRMPPKAMLEIETFVGDLCFRQENRLEQAGDVIGDIFKERVMDPVSEKGQLLLGKTKHLVKQTIKPLHSDLATLRKLVEQNNQALQAPKPNRELVQVRLERSLDFVKRIIRDKASIFTKCPLTDVEDENLDKLQRALQQACDKGNMTPQIMNKVHLFVEGLCQRQESYLEQGIRILNKKFVNPLSEKGQSLIKKGEHFVQETVKDTNPHVSELRKIFRQYKTLLAHPPVTGKIDTDLDSIRADNYKKQLELLISSALVHIGEIDRNKSSIFSKPSSIEKPLKDIRKSFDKINGDNRKPSSLEIARIETDIQQLSKEHGAHAAQLADTMATTAYSSFVEPSFDRVDQTVDQTARKADQFFDKAAKGADYFVDRTKRHLEDGVNHVARAGNQFLNEADFLVTKTEHRVKDTADNLAGRVTAAVDHTVAAADLPLQKAKGIVDTIDNLPTSWGNQLDQLLKGYGINIKNLTGSASEDGTPSGLLNVMGKAVGSLLSTGGKALSGKVIASGASLLLAGMKEINRQIPETPEFSEQRKTLGALIAQVEDLEINPSADSLAKLPQALNNAVVVFNKVTICVNGYFLPHGNLDDDFLHHTNYFDHQKILNKARGTSDIGEKNYEALSKVEKDKFIRNTAALLTLLSVYGDTCGINVDHNYCIAMMHRAEKQKVSLKSLVFEDLKRQHTSWWNLFWAWISYSLVHSVIEKFVHRASDAYFEEIFQYINKEKQNGFKGLTKTLLTNVNEYLPTLDRAYEKVPTIQNRYGSVKTLLGEEMAQPAGNGNQNVDKLYEELIQNVVRKAKAKAKGLVVEPVIFWVFGKVIAKKQDMVRNTINSSIESLRDVNGYAHARDVVVCEFLESIYASLAQDDTSKPKTGSAATRFSKDRREVLSLFVENLFDVLKKSECNQVKKLRALRGSGDKETQDYPNETLLNFVKGPIYKSTGVKIDDYIMNQVIEKASLSLADALEAMVNKDHLQKLAYNFIHLANSVYDTQAKAPSVNDKSDTEDLAQTLVDDILRISISKSVDELSVAWKEEQNQVNAAVADLRVKTKKRIANSRSSLKQLRTMDLSTLDAQIKVERLFAESDAFRIEGSKAVRDIRKSEWNEINKKALEERHQTIASQTTPLVTAIASIYSQMRVLKNHTSLVPLLRKVMQTAQSFDNALFASGKFVSHLSTMEKDLGQIYTLLPAARAEELQKLFKNFADNIREIHDAQRERDAIYNLLSPSSAINQMLSLKRTQPSEVRKAYDALQQQIAQAIPLSEQRPFMEALDRLVQAPRQDEEAEKRAFVQLGKRTLEELGDFLNQSIRDHAKHSTALCHAITKDGYLKREYIPKQKVAIWKDVNTALGHLRDIETNYPGQLTDVPFLNIQLPIKFLEPKQVKGIVKHAVYNRTQTYAGQLVRLASQEEVLPSVFNNMVIRPYNQSERRKRRIYT